MVDGRRGRIQYLLPVHIRRECEFLPFSELIPRQLRKNQVERPMADPVGCGAAVYFLLATMSTYVILFSQATGTN